MAEQLHGQLLLELIGFTLWNCTNFPVGVNSAKWDDDEVWIGKYEYLEGGRVGILQSLHSRTEICIVVAYSFKSHSDKLVRRFSLWGCSVIGRLRNVEFIQGV
jgi:hypothetical protein